MAKRRKTIPLFDHEDRLLRRLYKEFRIPSDQYEKRPEDFALFVATWNDLSERHDSPGDILHYIKTKRKQTKRLKIPWPTFDGTHERAPRVGGMLGDGEWHALRGIYARVVLARGLGTDNIAYDEELQEELSTAFAKATGRVIPGLLLSAMIVEKRKQKNQWFTLRDDYKDRDIGFDDIDELEA